MGSNNSDIFGISGGGQAHNFSEAELRFAMEHSKSIRDVANFLKVSHATAVKYLKLYSDPDERTLYEVMRDRGVKSKQRKFRPKQKGSFTRPGGMKKVPPRMKHPPSDYYNNYVDFPDVHIHTLVTTFIALGEFPPTCALCGEDSRRASDGLYPLLFSFKDEDPLNQAKDNIYLTCLNCQFLYGISKVRKRRIPDNSMFIKLATSDKMKITNNQRLVALNTFHTLGDQRKERLRRYEERKKMQKEYWKSKKQNDAK